MEFIERIQDACELSLIGNGAAQAGHFIRFHILCGDDLHGAESLGPIRLKTPADVYAVVSRRMELNFIHQFKSLPVTHL